MNYRSITLAIIGIIVYYSLYTAINPIILGFTGDNPLVDFLAKVIPLVIFFAIIFSAFTGNDAKNYKYSYALFVGVFLLFVCPASTSAGLTDNLIRNYDYTGNHSYSDLLGLGSDLDMYNFFKGNNGSVSGGVTIEDGAMVFDGVNGYVNCANPFISRLNETSISVWFKLNNVSKQQVIFGKSITSSRLIIGIYILNTGFIRGQVNDELNNLVQVTGPQLIKDTWYNAVLTYTLGETILYVNNISYGPSAVATQSLLNTNFYIGRWGSYSSNYLDGYVDSALIYNKALSQSEITEIYNAGQYSYTPIKRGLVAQYSGKDYEGSASNPTSITDTYAITYDSLTGTNRLKFNYSDLTYLYSIAETANIMKNEELSISFFTNVTDSSRYVFNIKSPNLPTSGDYLSHKEYTGTLKTGYYDSSESTWRSTTNVDIGGSYNELRNIFIGLNANPLISQYYYNNIEQEYTSTTVDSYGVNYLHIGKQMYGYFSNFLIWNNTLTDLQIRLINGGWSYNQRNKTGFAVQNTFSNDWYDDYIIQIEDMTTNIKTNYTPTRGVVFVELDNFTSYNVTAININDDFANSWQEITGDELEILFSVFDYNSILINVYDEETKELITENVTLKYSKDVTTTEINDTGSFYLINLSSGLYQLNLFSDNYLDRYYYVSVVNNANTTLNAYLLSSTSALSRAVNVLCGSTPQEDALISFYIAYNPATYTLVAQRYTDGFGQANFFLNPDTNYRLVIENNDDIYITSVTPTATPITINVCQDTDQPYNYTKIQDLFSAYMTPTDSLIDIETTNFTLNIVSSGGYIQDFGIYTTYNSVNYSSSLSNSTSGGSVRIEVPISTAQDLINVYWYVNTTNNETYQNLKVYKTKLFTTKGNSSFFQVFEDYEDSFGDWWKYVFVTFIAILFMLATAQFIAPMFNAFIGLAVFIVFAYLGWISIAYILPMGAILILYVMVRR